MAHRHHNHGSRVTTTGDTSRQATRALRWALVLNGGFLVIEAFIGMLTGSLALLSDAVHMVSDVAALGIALAAVSLARRAASDRRSYGYRRAEVLAALINSAALLFACVFIVQEAIERLWADSPALSGWPILVVGGLGLLINLGSAWQLYRADSDGLNMRGALLHMLADAAGSAGAVIAAIFVLLGFPAADAIVSLVIGALILWSGYRLLWDACAILLDFAPGHIDVEEVRTALVAIDGVTDVHDLHIWSLDGQELLLTVHLRASSSRVTMPAAAVLRERFAIAHTTIQIDTDDTCTSGGRCALIGA